MLCSYVVAVLSKVTLEVEMHTVCLVVVSIIDGNTI